MALAGRRARPGIRFETTKADENYGPSHAPPRNETLTTKLGEAFLHPLDLQDDYHTESQALIRKTLS